MTDTPPQERRIPGDSWQCCQCRNANLNALADEVCPVCAHAKCGHSCRGPGEKIFDPNLEYGTVLSDGTSTSHVYGQDLEPSSAFSNQASCFDLPCKLDPADDQYTPRFHPEGQKEWGISGSEESGLLPSVPSSQPIPEAVWTVPTQFDDVWTCCECDAANYVENSPDRCPICAHYKCRQCAESQNQ